MKTLLAACLLTLAALPAAAQYGPADYLAGFDTNHDGRVSLDEYLAWMGAGFTRLDRNGDGVLEPDELPPGPRRGVALTLAQHRANLTAAFRRQDTNHDGYLDLHELTAPPR